MARGHGRVAGILRPCSMRSISDGISIDLQLSKKASHVLEPGDERRGKINSRDQNQREMRKHRHIGGLG